MIMIMKRIIFTLITALFIGVLGANAQNANRKGFFMELQGGQTIGYVYRSDNNKNYLKGGMDFGLNFGFRLPTSNQWAFQMKLSVTDNLSATKVFMPALLFGMRWISSDFAGNKSAYIGLNTGVGFAPLTDNCGVYVPVDIEAGVNITNKLYAGIYVTPRISCDSHCLYEYIYWYEDNYNNIIESARENYNKYLKSNTVVGLRVGYRF